MNQDYQELIRQMLDEAGLINKELTFGCVIRTGNGTEEVRYVTDTISAKYRGEISMDKNWKNKPMEIIGHPWDLREVMAWFQKKGMLGNTEIKLILNLDLSEPLSQQDLKPLYELMKGIEK